MILMGFDLILNVVFYTALHVCNHMMPHVRIYMTPDARNYITTNVRPRLRMCGRICRMSRFPDVMIFWIFRVPLNAICFLIYAICYMLHDIC